MKARVWKSHPQCAALFKRFAALALVVVMLLGMSPAITPVRAAQPSGDGNSLSEAEANALLAGAGTSLVEIALENNLLDCTTEPYGKCGGGSHMQGICVDDELKYMYFSYTSALGKIDIETGELVGNVIGLGTAGISTCHLGCLEYYDGHIYGSLEYKTPGKKFLLAVFDADAITKQNMSVRELVANGGYELRSVLLYEPTEDFRDGLSTTYFSGHDSNGQATDGANNGHRFACSGIDGVTVGTWPGDTSDDPTLYMIVAYGVYEFSSDERQDNTYNVLQFYRMDQIWNQDGTPGTTNVVYSYDLGRELAYEPSTALHAEKTLYVYTGNTNYGAQNIEYEWDTRDIVLYTYVHTDSYGHGGGTLYVVDGSVSPTMKTLELGQNNTLSDENQRARVKGIAEAYATDANDNKTIEADEYMKGYVATLKCICGDASKHAADTVGDACWGNSGVKKADQPICSGTQPQTSVQGIHWLGADPKDSNADYYYICNGTYSAGLYRRSVDSTTGKWSSFTKANPTVNTSAKKLVNYSMDAADLYTGDDGTVYLKNTLDNSGKYDAIVEGTSSAAGVQGGDGSALSFDAWKYPDRVDQVYLNDATIAYINQEIDAKTGYGNYSYSFWAKMPDSKQTDGNFIPFAGFYREDGTYASVFELRWRNAPGHVTNGIGDAAPGAGNIKVDGKTKVVYNPSNNDPGDSNIYLFGYQVAPPNPTAWHMYTVTENAGSVSIYFDGQLIKEKTISPADHLKTEPFADFILGGGAGKVWQDMNNRGRFIGEIDDVTIYSGVLTADEVAAAYAAKPANAVTAPAHPGVEEKTTTPAQHDIPERGTPVVSFDLSSNTVSGTTVTGSNGITGIVSGNVAYTTDHLGSANGAMVFDGYDYKEPTYVKLSDADADWLNSVIEDGYTMNFWARADAENGNKMVFAGLYDADARPLGVIETNDGEGDNSKIDGQMIVQANAAVRGTQTAQNAKNANTVATGVWTMYTAVYDKASGTMKLYVNGVPAASTAVADDIIGSIDQLFIGHQYQKYYYNNTNATADWTTRGGFYGAMESFDIYNYAMTADEVLDLAEKDLSEGMKAKHVLHWTMDAGTLNNDGTIKDSSTNNYLSYYENVTPVKGVDGKDGGALYFNGAADTGEYSRVWLSDAGVAGLNEDIDGEITVAFWMNPDSSQTPEKLPYTAAWSPVGGIFGGNASVKDDRFILVAEYRDNQLVMCRQGSGTKASNGDGDERIYAKAANDATAGTDDNTWYYVVMTFSNDESTKSGSVYYSRIFITDTSSGTTYEYSNTKTSTGTITGNSSNDANRVITEPNHVEYITHVEFGGQYAKGHWYDTNVRGRYIGAIDDIAIYNVPFTKADVEGCYAASVTTLDGTSRLTSAPAELKYFESSNVVFDKLAPQDLTFTATSAFGTPVSVSASGFTTGLITISGNTVTVTKEYLAMQPAGQVDITVNSVSGSQIMSFYVINSANPVLYYKMDKADLTTTANANGTVDGTLADKSGSGVDLQVSGLVTGAIRSGNGNSAATGVSAGADTATDGALFFDGYRDYDVSHGYLDDAGMAYLNSAIGNEITISFWHKSDRISSNYMPVVGLFAEDNRPLLLAEFRDSGGERKTVDTESTTPALTATPAGSYAITDNTVSSSSNVTTNSSWHHYVVTYNNTTGAAAIYVDGTSKGSGTLPAGQLNSIDQFIIGAMANPGYYNLAGSNADNTLANMKTLSHGGLYGHLDDVRVYNRVLTADEISAVKAFSTVTPDTSIGATITNVSITVPDKTAYKPGEELDVAGGKLVLTFSDSTTIDVPLTADMVSGFDSLTAGRKNLTVRYIENDVVRTVGYTVTVAELKSIEVTTLPKTIYSVGDTLDVAGGKVTLTYTDNSTVEVDLEPSMVSGFDSTKGVEGKTLTVTVTDSNVTKTTTYTVDIVKAATEITFTAPSKTAYAVNEVLDVTGGKFTVTYDDGSSKVVDLTTGMVTGFSSAVDNQNLVLNVSYTEGGITCDDSYTVTITKKLLTIQITSLPKVLYAVNEALDVTGGKLTLLYDDGSSEEIALTADMVSAFDSSTAGAKLLTVTYSGKTTSLTVVVNKALSSITLSTLPTKLTYAVGEALDVTGGELTLTYDDGSTETVTLEAGMVFGFISSVGGEKALTVNYAGKTTNFTVTVVRALESIRVTGLKTGYTVGDELDLSGAELALSYDDGTTDTVALEESMISGFDTTSAGTKTLTVTYEGKTTTVEITVSVPYTGGTGGTTTTTTTTTTSSTTKPDGTTVTTTTTKKPDGSTEEVQTEEKIVVDENGTEVKETTTTTTGKTADGTTATTKESSNGTYESEVKLSAAAVQEAAKNGTAVQLPVPEVPVANELSEAATIQVSGAATQKVDVVIPVEDGDAGTVAVLVHADGTEEILLDSVMTEEGLQVGLKNGDTVKIVDKGMDFIDVHESDWENEAVEFISARGVMQGVASEIFAPDTVTTRAMIWTMLARLSGEDTSGGETWYEKGREWAMELGISDGTNPEATVTREQLATMLHRFVGSPAADHDISDYDDHGAISDWAREGKEWAVANGVIKGKGNGVLDPLGDASRAEVAQMIMNFLKNIGL